MNIIIDSQRGYVKWPWFQIVYEWEDCLVSNIPNSRLKLISKIDRYIDAFFVKTNFKFQNLFTVWGRQKLHLRYEMSALTHQSFNNRSNVVPIIIDYFLKDEDIPAFDKAHCHNPLVLITSKEAYEHLKQKSQLPLAHWPLSLPDKYKEKEDVKFEKKYDIAINGRKNPTFDKYLKQYIDNHPEMTWVTSGKRRFDFIDNNGINIGYFETREDFIKLLRMTRIALYSTPSMDGSRPDANGYNQVTPKFLEYISSQCHVLLRYEKNPDTDFYELSKFGKNIESYEDFEKAMEEARIKDVNTKEYLNYLDKHITSNTIGTLLKYLERI